MLYVEVHQTVGFCLEINNISYITEFVRKAKISIKNVPLISNGVFSVYIFGFLKGQQPFLANAPKRPLNIIAEKFESIS